MFMFPSGAPGSCPSGSPYPYHNREWPVYHQSVKRRAGLRPVIHAGAASFPSSRASLPASKGRSVSYRFAP